MRKIMGPLAIAAATVAISSVWSLCGSVTASTPLTKDQIDARAASPTYGEGRALTVNAGSVGTNDDPYSDAIYRGRYGPVDQNAPLNFADQPKSVPRNYVAGRLYNVQVLKQYSYVQLIGQMAYYTQALGVQCSYCHNTNNFAYDTATKRIARTMQIMSNGVQQEWIETAKRDYPKYAVSGAVGCVTCHRGQPYMGVKWDIVPVQYLNSVNKSTRQAGYVVNAMYSASRSLGVNCLFCHNSADFVSLQYYPTNKIAHRMWAMVDDINHKYLPPNVKAVTCYTCHQGAKWPSALVKAGLDQTPANAVAAYPDYQANPGAHAASEAMNR